jgi:hypothetical protein
MKDFYVKVYLTNLGKYVEGYLVGKWVDVKIGLKNLVI